MRRIRKSAAVQRFDQAWELFCGLLPKAAPPIVADIRSRALLAAGVVQGQDMDDEQATRAAEVIYRLNYEIADYRRARHEVIDAFVHSVAGGRAAADIRRRYDMRAPGSAASDWRKASETMVELLGGA